MKKLKLSGKTRQNAENKQTCNFFSAVKDAGFNPVLEYAGDDASYHSDPGKSASSSQTSASDEIQPLWTAQLRASLTQIYEKCSVTVPAPLQRPSHLRPLLSQAELEAKVEAAAASTQPPQQSQPQTGPQSSESDLSNSVA